MKKNFLFLKAVAVFLFVIPSSLLAQDWHLAGNSDANSGSKLGTTTNANLRLFSNNNERMRINASNGWIGVGTTTPRGRFTLYNGAASVPAASWVTATSPMLVSYADGTAGNGDFYLLQASNSVGTRSNIINRRARGTLSSPAAVVNNDYIGSFQGSGYDGSAFQNAANIDFFADGTPSAGNVPIRIAFSTGTNLGNRTERVKILSNGNIAFNSSQLFVQNATARVGIGTTAPATTLDITGGNWDVNNTEGDVRIGNATYRLKIGVATGGGGAGDVRIRAVGGTSRLMFGAGDALTIGGTGNVGIGTITPTYKLSVNGTIRSKEVRVETGWADYVFENDYRLPPLHEVAQYIEQHKHLPNVPSAGEIKENGLALGEMQTKMMEKIEELTLYIIDLQKQIEQLKAAQK